MLTLCNAFSLSMVNDSKAVVEIEELSIDEARKMVREEKWESAVGHESTASFLSQLLGVNVPTDRKSISLGLSDKLLVLQLMQRLPEGVVLDENQVRSIPHKLYLVKRVS